MAKQKTGKGKGIGTGVAIAGAALAAAAAGYYFYASDDAKKHRAKAAKWAGGFKKEVASQIKKAGKIDRKTIAAAVDRAASMYKSARNVDAVEVVAAAKEIKDHWQDLASEMTKGAAKNMTRAMKSTRKSMKSSPRKKVAKKRSR